jgi:hypothetical protein
MSMAPKPESSAMGVKLSLFFCAAAARTHPAAISNTTHQRFLTPMSLPQQF